MNTLHALLARAVADLVRARLDLREGYVLGVSAREDGTAWFEVARDAAFNGADCLAPGLAEATATLDPAADLEAVVSRIVGDLTRCGKVEWSATDFMG